MASQAEAEAEEASAAARAAVAEAAARAAAAEAAAAAMGLPPSDWSGLARRMFPGLHSAYSSWSERPVSLRIMHALLPVGGRSTFFLLPPTHS
jgi:hypothetical protein